MPIRSSLLPPCLAALLALACGGNPKPSETFSPAPQAGLPMVLEGAASTPHRITLGGAAVDYTATAGHLTAFDPAGGAPEAAIFYVAYSADGLDPASRPVTFLYNGGPGSSSVWLHLGSFGPRRLVTSDPDPTAALPFPLVDNPESLLDVTDLVFVDPVGTGFSEAISPRVNRDFWGVDADAAVLRDFILRYREAYGREVSPTYLFGESYGTPRTAVLANLLGEAGVGLAGVVLQSSILNYNSDGDAGPGVGRSGFLPSYSAVGAYFGLDAPAPADLTAFLQQMRDFTATSYAPALTGWLATKDDPGLPLATQLAGATGIPAASWRADLNLAPADFRTQLLPGTLIGRYDARVTAPLGSPLASGGDPSSSFITQPFTDAMASYLTTFLGYPQGAGYAVTGEIGDLWDFSHDGLALPDTIPDLAAALARNPGLKVLSLNGYHDLATPFYQTELDLARLGAQPGLRIQHYPGGHMTYLDDSSRPLEKADLAAFYLDLPGAVQPLAAVPRARLPRAPAAPWLRPGLPLTDPYVPPDQRHPLPGPATRGEALRLQVERKLHPDGSHS